ncbi:MAG: GIY-YIG nuclease family protein [Chloroflexi bacterium]|nr:GIY-YIG nuclease family protein [Chloroflexota bacterium]
MPQPRPFHSTPFLVVDLETTGGSALFDRIIEVAAVRVEDGRVVERIETLVDPGTGVPPFITRLTGITPHMVRGRPRIESLLPDLGRMAEGAVLVAHNVAFDAGFLAATFRRAGIAWLPERLCTLRLARRLIHGLHSYKLDSLCAHLGIDQVQTHRAGADCRATAVLLDHLLAAACVEGLDDVNQLLTFQERPIQHKRRKAKVDESQVAALTTGPGVYLLKDAQGHVVYVGKSINVRTRVRTHLRPSGTAGSMAQPRLRRRLPYIADVEAIETGSELEALILESKLVKRYLPAANAMLRDYRDYPFVRVDVESAFARVEATRERPRPGAVYLGPFRKAGVVARAALFVSEALGLRQCQGKLPSSACPLLDIGKCSGPCIGGIDVASYQLRVARALRVLRGEDAQFVAEQEARRDALAAQLRFEAAAELRDRLRDLAYVVRTQTRLDAFSDRHLVIVAPAPAGAGARLFIVRGGRLVRDVSVAFTARPATLGAALRSAYGGVDSTAVSRDDVDDMLILDSWLRAARTETHQVEVTPEEPEAAVAGIRTALARLAVAPTR